MRQIFQLTEIEYKQFTRLKPFQGEAFEFWKRAAKRRELDPSSVISNGQTFTALPVGHGKYWCYPLTLGCKKKPNYAEI